MVSVIGKLVIVVPVIAPEQLSLAVGAVSDARLHSSVISDKFRMSATGAVLSSIITF